MTFSQRVATLAFLLGIGACALSMSGKPTDGVSLVPSAHAQGLIRNLIARLRGEALPDGIVKSNGASRRPRLTSHRNIRGASRK